MACLFAAQASICASWRSLLIQEETVSKILPSAVVGSEKVYVWIGLFRCDWFPKEYHLWTLTSLHDMMMIERWRAGGIRKLDVCIWVMDGWWMDDGWIDVLDLLQGTVRKVTARVSVEVGGIYPLINWADAMQHQISQYSMNTISILIYTQSLL